MVPLKHIASLNLRKLDESTDPDLEFLYIDIGSVGRGTLVEPPELTRFSLAPTRARRLVRPGDTIVSTVRTYLRAVLPIQEVSEPLVVSTGFAVVTPRDVEPRFLAWYLQSDPFVDEVVARSTGVSYPAINPSDMARLLVPVPPVARQRAVAAFLESETTRLDALIHHRRRMARLLAQRISSQLDRLVLGLDGPKLEPSRSGYFQAVPCDWSETSARHLGCSVQTGPFGSQLHQEEYVVGGWPVVNPLNLQRGEIVGIDTMTISDAKRAELGRHVLKPGDIVFGRRGEMGRAGLVGDDQAGWLCGTGSLRLRLAEDAPLRPPFLKLLLESAALRAYFELTSVGSTMDNLNSEILLAMPCLVPPQAEQERIEHEVGDARRAHRAAMRSMNRQLELLEERRAALITAAVTGELDIPGVAA